MLELWVHRSRLVDRVPEVRGTGHGGGIDRRACARGAPAQRLGDPPAAAAHHRIAIGAGIERRRFRGA